MLEASKSMGPTSSQLVNVVREYLFKTDTASPSANFSLADAHRAFLSTKWYDITWEKVIRDRHVEKHLDDFEVFTHAAELNIDGPDQGNNNPDYAEAMSGPERQQWIEGMQKEIASEPR